MVEVQPVGVVMEPRQTTLVRFRPFPCIYSPMSSLNELVCLGVLYPLPPKTLPLTGYLFLEYAIRTERTRIEYRHMANPLLTYILRIFWTILFYFNDDTYSDSRKLLLDKTAHLLGTIRADQGRPKNQLIWHGTGSE